MRILTFDLEEWFHILAHNATAFPHQWDNFESRIQRNTDILLEVLNSHNQHTTFFCLGWIAKKYPEIIRQIKSRGHEIACHGMNHQLVYQQTPKEFKQDLQDSLKLLEDVSGNKIETYRAAGFSITSQTKWAFEVLAECGIKIDCSIFPEARNHGGYKDFPVSKPCIIQTNGVAIKEFPLNPFRFGAMKIVFSGGGYFRMLPYSLVKTMMNKSDYVMTYFHLRDFDSEQPMIASLPAHRKFMSYIGLKNALSKFERLLDGFSFNTVAEAQEKVDWNSVSKVQL